MITQKCQFCELHKPCINGPLIQGKRARICRDCLKTCAEMIAEDAPRMPSYEECDRIVRSIPDEDGTDAA